ncbi:MAG: family 43 glycosylhydrolase, partial [Candidatus Kerfeldbacteria bacterium]|nr:family 43 glycosylhydrolase [Candidatus Kerfeldbacteria bacterium]
MLVSVAIVAAGVTFFTSSLPDSFSSFWRDRSRILGWSVADSDADGFDSVDSAGTDCTDQPYSVYMDGTAGCDSTADPVFLESKSDPDTDDDIADHAWFQGADDLYHLYYQNEDQGSGDDIEHYTSTDLTSLTYVGLALEKSAGAWDPYGLWAPHVIQSGDTYYMFYTGTTGAGSNPTAKQRIGLATSSDLTTWTKYPVNNCATTSGDGCIYECNETWTTWDDGGSYDAQCRDPMVIWDATNSRWLMFATVRLTAATGATGVSGGISVATSTNLVDWTGLGYIAATRRRSAGEGGTLGQLAGTQSENPEVTYFDGTYYLFFNDWEDTEDSYGTPNARTQTQYASSATLDVDSSGSANWTYRGYTEDPGTNAAEIETWYGDTWIMSQSISNANAQYYGTHARDLQLKRVEWNDDFTFTTSKLTDFDCRVASSAINPDAAEVCDDLIDNNCSGAADEDLYCGACVDADSDDYGSSGLYACPNATADCDDASDVTYPTATEICDSVDNDCDGTVDEAGACSTCTEDWSCGAWSSCSVSGIQTRTCTDANACGTTADRPARIQACVPDPQDCTEAWTCSAWSVCSNDTQARTCTDANAC